MSQEFYYLEGKEQKGPFNVEKLRTLSLRSDTLVWTEDFDNWKPVKEVEQLKILLKKTPPPPPIIDNIPYKTETEELENKKVILEDSDVKFWATFKIWTVIFVLIGIVVLVVYSYIEIQKKQMKDEIYSKIERILDGKTTILDGVYFLTQGELKETDFSSSKTDFSYFSLWWEREKLYTIYTATHGGFTVKQLTRQNKDGFDIETNYSGDMGYKKPTRRYVQPQYIDDGWGGRYKFSDGYYVNNNRLPVRECYRETFEYFTKDDRKSPGAYSPGKYTDITNFPDIRNKYFYMQNTYPKQYTSSGYNYPSWESTDAHGANINTEDWVVYYKVYGKHYELTENKENINEDLYTILAIALVFFILFLLIIRLSKPKYFKNLNLFGKRWKNVSYPDQIFYFEHSFFGKYTFVEIINDKLYRGVVKITDKGSTLNLLYTNKELFYKIDELKHNNLTLISFKDKNSILFTRVGAEQNDKNVTEELITNQENENDEPNQ